jgi:hypothetical protein
MLMLVVLVLFPFLIWQAYKKLRFAKKSSTWPTTPGVVTAAERIKLAWRTQPRVSFSYDVGGKAYTSSKVSFADVVPARETEPILSRYPLHHPVVVHYQPEDPALAVLEPGPNRYVTATFRNYLIWFAFIIFLNVFNIAFGIWQYTHDSEEQPVRTYDDVAKADPQLGNRLLRQDADNGNAQDQVYVAVWYLTGTEGYPKDPVKPQSGCKRPPIRATPRAKICWAIFTRAAKAWTKILGKQLNC